MKRLTRRIGVFGGTGSMMSAMGGKSSVPAAPTVKPKPAASPVGEEPRPSETPKKKSWLGRLFGGGDEEK